MTRHDVLTGCLATTLSALSPWAKAKEGDVNVSLVTQASSIHTDVNLMPFPLLLIGTILIAIGWYTRKKKQKRNNNN